jgi:putative cell wall-binding protein
VAPQVPSDVYRISGSNRFETAFAIADAMKDYLKLESFETILVASGIDFADALSGSYLAAIRNAPILITDGRNGKDLKAYITANLSKGGTVYILGGPAAVPQNIQDTLAEAGLNVTRLAGSDRYRTNLAILEEAGIRSIQEILICSSTDFPDALSASAVGLPIMLTGPKLTDEQADFLRTTSRRFFIIGGTAAVNQEVEDVLNQIGESERISGANRYQTSTAVADRFFLAPSAVVLAFGNGFPDGLCGGPLAHAIGIPLLLTEQGLENAAASYCADVRITAGAALGGTSVLSDGTIRKVFSLADNAAINLYE